MESKNNFLKGRMNKDVDERLLQKGEYRDARNISISSSDTGNSGSIETVAGNRKVSDFGLSDRNLEIIGRTVDNQNGRIFFYITNYADSSFNSLSRQAPESSAHYITCYDTINEVSYVLVSGSFLNFSKTHRIVSSNILEDLLLWTDNRNQPRKINAKTAIINSNSVNFNPYYFKEEHISVAKYYPYNPIKLYKPDSSGVLNERNSDLSNSAVTFFSDNNVPLGTYNYSLANSDCFTENSSATGEFTMIHNGALVTSISVTNGGSGLSIGDTITFLDPITPTSLSRYVVKLREEDFYVESTMIDNISKDLPIMESFIVPIGANSGTIDSYSMGNGSVSEAMDSKLFVGCLVYIIGASGETTSISDKLTVSYISDVVGTDYTVGFNKNVNIEDGAIVYIGANPDYEESDILPNIEDKFIRFAYRFKFDDNEYSIISPFTQSVFIPKQDGFFLGDKNDSDSIDSDEQKAIDDTFVKFFENKVTKVELNIPLPEGVNSVSELSSECKIKEVEIIYKQSDEFSLKVVDSLTEEDFLGDSSDSLFYTYKSSKPVITLPEKELTRTSDKIPVRAKSQEVVGNRVVYANYLSKFNAVNSMDYTVGSSEKLFQSSGTGSFSRKEYPNHQLKQNRSYEVGIVLSDKFGRKSDVIVSKDSTIFHKYKDNEDSLISSTDIYSGDSLKIIFNKGIQSLPDSTGYGGVYNELTNPLGWYSYQVVVKQEDQSYYNVYSPTILNGSPIDGLSDLDISSAYITLHSDNINKVPRDLNNISSNDDNFISSEELFLRVSQDSYTDGVHNTKMYDSLSSETVNLIGTRDSLSLNKTKNGNDYLESPFYSIPKVSEVGFNPLIGRISTNNRAIGAQGGFDDSAGNSTNIYHNKLNLNILETKPTKSNIDIYYETSTSGLISDLNIGVLDPSNSQGVPFSISDFAFILGEKSVSGDLVTNEFEITDINGEEINNVTTTAKIISATTKSGVNSLNLFEIEKKVNNKFEIKLKAVSNPESIGFYYSNNSFLNETWDFLLEFTNSESTFNGRKVTGRVLLENNTLRNESPEMIQNGAFLGSIDPTLSTTTQYIAINVPELTPEGWREVSSVDVSNGAFYEDLSHNELVINIDKVEYLNTFHGEYRDYWYQYSLNLNSTRSNDLWTRSSPGLVKAVIMKDSSIDTNVSFNGFCKILYSPMLTWVDGTREEIIVGYTGSPNGHESTDYPYENVMIPLRRVHKLRSFRYSNDKDSLLDAGVSPAIRKNTSVTNGHLETPSLNDRRGILYMENRTTHTPNNNPMKVRLTVTLSDANSNGKSTTFFVFFDIDKPLI